MKSGFSDFRWLFFSAATILVVGLVVYQPALKIGFWTDDYAFIDAAGRLGFADYWISYLDPRLQWHWYRPMQGLFWWIGYALFRGDAMGYHAMQLGLHLANALLLFNLAARITRRWKLALIAAWIYVTLPAMNLAVLWVGVADPLVSFFYLLTVALWLGYLEKPSRARFGLAFLACVGALMSKEIAATLPVTLYLTDRWLIGKPLAFVQALKRHAPFVVALSVYVLFELNVLTRGVFTASLGYGVGGHVFSSLLHHATTLAFPWGIDSPLGYVLLFAALAAVGWAAVKRERRVLFLAAATVLTVLPVLPFPANMALAPRYLYLPLMGSAVGVALLGEGALGLGSNAGRRVAALGISLAVALLIAWQGAAIAEDATNFEGTARQVRLQFRPIFQADASFPPATLLYFINPPIESPYISGLFLLRYGANVVVGATDLGRVAGLRDHRAAIVFHQDDEKNWHRQAVEKDAATNVAPRLPANFGETISLDALELASRDVKRGDALVLILYWRALARVDRDYTVFVHLVDASGRMVAGKDAPPQQGASPTSRWRVNGMVADGIVMPIDETVVPGEYVVELGLYDAATMQRLAIVAANGQPITDKIVLDPIQISE